MADGTIEIKTNLQDDKLKKDLNNFKKDLSKEMSDLESFSNKSMKTIVTGVAAVSTAIVGIGTAAVKSYADLEQNIGGVETLFKDSANTVIENANKAYKTAGMSANEYMSTVTSFSASLLQSLGDDTKKASEYSDRAIRDMSDNANKMGTSMEMIQNAYQGFAKQNYTMLDNLKLGYGGTQEEMKRLIKDASKMTKVQKKLGITVDDSSMSFGNIVNAISVMQEKMGITGTTAKEAAETISGSVSSMKAAWDNFLNGSGDFSQVIEAAKTAFKNIYNAAKEQLPRIGKEIIASLPKEFVETVKNILPIIAALGTALGVVWGYFKMVSIIQSLTKAWTVLNGVIAANPILLVVTALAGLTAALVTHMNTIDSDLKKEKERTEEILNQKKALEELKEQQQENLNANLSEIDNVERLKNELTTLVDENGKIKEGYKGRVDFILGELNDALGTEYKATGDVISNYKELTKSIDEAIAKKKASIILSTQEEAYSNAIKNQAEATKKLGEIQSDLNNKIKERDKLEAEYAEKKSNLSNREKIEMQARITNLNTEVEATQKSYDEQKSILQTYYQDIATYETNAALIQEGSAESIKKVNDSVLYSYQNRKDNTIKTLTEGLNSEIAALNTYKDTYAKNQNEVTRNQIEESQNRLNTLVQELVDSTSAVNKNSPEVIKAWSDLATGSYDTYCDIVSKLPPDLSQKIEEMTGVTLKKSPELVSATQSMFQQVLNQIDKSPEFKNKAVKNLQGMLNGLQNEELRELLKEAGVEDVEKVMQGIREGNLAEDQGISILSNLKNGLNNSSWKESLFSSARGIASSLSSLLTVKANVNGKTSNLPFLPGHKSGLDYVPRDNYVARLHKGERVLTKEENKDYTEAIKLSKNNNSSNKYQSILNQMKKRFDLSKIYNKMIDTIEFETIKSSKNLTSNQIINIEKEDSKQARLESIDNNKEITVNSISILDGKVIAKETNKINAKQKIQYGLA